jgi:ABC-type phosphate/phosphonate transport system substrate-binding protein
VTEFAKVPGFIVMTSPALPAPDALRVKAAILQFPKTDDGRAFFSLTGFANIRAVTAAELKLLDEFVEQTRAGLGISR